MVKYNDSISYKILENGYEIYNDGKVWVRQLEPFAKLHDANGTYEENCLLQLAEITKPIEEPNPYNIPNDIYNAIIDDYTDELFEMGVL